MARLGPGYVWRRWLTVYEYLGGFDSLQGRCFDSGLVFQRQDAVLARRRWGFESPRVHAHDFCVCGRPARHALATRIQPGATPGRRSTRWTARAVHDTTPTRCSWWTRSPGTGERRVRLPRSAPRTPRHAPAHGCDPGLRSLVRRFDSARRHRAHVVQRPGPRLFTPGRRVRLPPWVPRARNAKRRRSLGGVCVPDLGIRTGD